MEDMRILVAYASVHGSTAEIARAIALTLRRAGMDVDVAPVNEIEDVRSYDSVIAGSAVYGGRWREDALRFLERFGPDLAHTRLWLFQSGPLGRSAQYIIRSLSANVASFAECMCVKGCATFGGKLDSTTPGPLAHILARAGLAHDYRDFSEIRMWAEEIARSTALGAGSHRTHTPYGRPVPASSRF